MAERYSGPPPLAGKEFTSVIKSFAIAIAGNAVPLSPGMETHLGCLEFVLYALEKAGLIIKPNRDHGLSGV